MNRFFHKELEQLRSHLIEMADKSTHCVRLALDALDRNDVALARKVLEMDDSVDALEVAIDAEASRYITLRAPVASDVRLITVAIKTSQDLERIADEASNIAKRIIRLAEIGPLPKVGMILEMGDLALALTREAMGCLLAEDAAKARAVPPKDKEIDRLHRKNFADFTADISAHPADAATYIELIFISKSIERIGDHATNIAEEFVYLLEGHDIRHTDGVKRSIDRP